MALSDQELAELKERCIYAEAHGFKIALAEHIAADLEEEGGDVPLEPGMVANSPGHLKALVCMVEKARSGSSKASKKLVGKPPKKAKEKEKEPEIPPAEASSPQGGAEGEPSAE